MKTGTSWQICAVIFSLFFLLPVNSQDISDSLTAEQELLEQRKYQEDRPARPRRQRRIGSSLIEKAEQIDDQSPQMNVRTLKITGSQALSEKHILNSIPPVYQGSGETAEIYDFREFINVLHGQPGLVSARTMQGLTRYIVELYQNKGYAGIYAYIPQEIMTDGPSLIDNTLVIHVIEAGVEQVDVSFFNSQGQLSERIYLNREVFLGWSPVKENGIVNRTELDNTLNLLNRNPDRHISATVSRGNDPNSLRVNYEVYEANPWHFFIQADNAGVKERQWAPRVGLINTNLTGRDDRLTTVYQAPWDSGITDNYALFGSYDFPLFHPRLRLNLFGGYNEFEIDSKTADISFLGRGHFYGGEFRYNLNQFDSWMLDITGSLTRERSRSAPAPFPELQSDFTLTMGGFGAELHQRTDLISTMISYNFSSLLNNPDFSFARTNVGDDFTIHTAALSHSRYLDRDRVNKIVGSLRFITSDDRLVPAKMTSFGGMYSVRGYNEAEIIADGGILSSIQFEHNLITQNEREDFIKRFAPVLFWDFGRAQYKSPTAPNEESQNLSSLGTGLIIEATNHFTGVIYYGYPLVETDRTRKGKGRVNIGLLARW